VGGDVTVPDDGLFRVVGVGDDVAPVAAGEMLREHFGRHLVVGVVLTSVRGRKVVLAASHPRDDAGTAEPLEVVYPPHDELDRRDDVVELDLLPCLSLARFQLLGECR